MALEASRKRERLTSIRKLGARSRKDRVSLLVKFPLASFLPVPSLAYLESDQCCVTPERIKPNRSLSQSYNGDTAFVDPVLDRPKTDIISLSERCLFH